MKKSQRIHNVWKLLSNYILFFVLVAFVITCSTMLFVSMLADDLGVTLTRDNITPAAKVTLLNSFVLSLLYFLVDIIRRKLMVEKPVKKIQDALEKMTNGDYSARIETSSVNEKYNSFGDIGNKINRLGEELSGVETLRTDFIANVSHELKTPLSVIQNYGTMLQSPDLSDKKRIEYAKGITEGSRKLSSLITNILKLNKLENQQIYPTFTEYNLGEQLCECLLLFEDEWEKKELEINTYIEEDVIIRSDAELLRHVWNNLFSNAIKFTDAKGSVSVSLKSDDNHVIVKVSDTGCGMSAEVGKHIFDKFYQGDSSHGTQGNGLGLALVKRVVDIMHGEISVESMKGKGSIFTVKIRRE